MRLMRTLNRKVCEAAEDGNYVRIGTTAAGIFFDRDFAYSFNVGDSPIRLFRNQKMESLSQNHTDEEFLRELHITNRSPGLIQFLGIPEEEMLIEPYIQKTDLKSGDIFLICSDGLTDMLSDEKICERLLSAASIQEIVTELLEDALNAGGADNITIVLCKVK